MKGFLLGVLCTVVVGGFFFYIQTHYDTLDPCTALERNLTAAVNASIEVEVQKRSGSAVVGEVANALIKPVAAPVIAAEVKKQTGDQNWFQCAYEILKLDFLGQKSSRVDQIKKSLAMP